MNGDDAAGFTGERYLPALGGTIALEHWHRYAIARALAEGRDVLDAACGEGYGAAHLAGVARSAIGIDVSVGTVRSATRNYGARGARYCAASVGALPFADASFDLVVSFETVEHVSEGQQQRMIDEFARVLRPDGMLLISSPNPVVYTERSGQRNEFHVRELYRDELDALLARRFAQRRWHAQKVVVGSGLWTEEATTAGEAEGTVRAELVSLAHGAPAPYVGSDPMYYVVVATNSARPPSAALPAASVMIDADERVLGEHARESRECMRLDRLLAERDATIAATTPELERRAALVELRDEELRNRDRMIARLTRAIDAQREEIASLAAAADEAREAASRHADDSSEALRTQLASEKRRSDAAHARLDELVRHLQDRDRVVLYRQSWRWWLKLPLVRIRWYLGSWHRSDADVR